MTRDEAKSTLWQEKRITLDSDFGKWAFAKAVEKLIDNIYDDIEKAEKASLHEECCFLAGIN